MNITLAAASAAVDQFEQLLASNSIDVPQHPQTDADMLSIWQLMKMIRDGVLQSPQPVRIEYAAALAMHDLAAKVLQVANSSQFPKLIPHLAMLAKGAVHLTQTPPAQSDGYNKLIEVYWACLCLAQGLEIDLDHPEHANGTNPDIITNAPPSTARYGYAFKTIRSPHPQTLLDRLVEGIDQIERSNCSEGIVAFQLTPRMQLAALWSSPPFPTWMDAADVVIDECRKMLSQVIADNGQKTIDDLFAGKKAVGSVLCVVHAPILAISPLTGLATAMPLKVPAIIGLSDVNNISAAFYAEMEAINHSMQSVL